MASRPARKERNGNGNGKAHSVQWDLGALTSGQREIFKRLGRLERSMADTQAAVGRIEGALELRPAMAFSVPKPAATSAAADVVVSGTALSDDDKQALRAGRFWQGVGSALEIGKKNLVALAAVAGVVVLMWMQLRGGKLPPSAPAAASAGHAHSEESWGPHSRGRYPRATP